jgi:hypothetical protein
MIDAQILSSETTLRDFLAERAPIDRAQVVAHATLSAWVHHWPSRATLQQQALLQATVSIKDLEHSRWITQRRIAIGKLARLVEAVSNAS